MLFLFIYSSVVYMLSFERATTFTEISPNFSIYLKPEFVFKGKCTRISLKPGIKFQRSDSDSC